MTDERCLPEGSAERNDRMLFETLVQPLGIKHSDFYRIPGELGPIQGSIEYSNTLAQVPDFDIALLVLGEDGHVASIFFDHPTSESLAYGVLNSPKWPQERITMSAGCLRRARAILLVASGRSKCVALKDAGNPNSVVQKVLKGHKNVTLLTDINSDAIELFRLLP